MPPSIILVQKQAVRVEPLTQANFAPFGTVIQNPNGALAPLAPLPTNLPANASHANQNTAVKYSNVTQLTNFYDQSASRQPGKPAVSLFASKPRSVRRQGSMTPIAGAAISSDLIFSTPTDRKVELSIDVKVLERHPFTSQTFVPLALPSKGASTCYLVVVAPTKPHESEQRGWTWRSLLPYPGSRADGTGPKGSGPPNLDGIRAFIASGNQAVTYGAGTWHAPMIVLGTDSVDFVVWQHANGVANDDCQEVLLQPARENDGGVSVVLELPSSCLPHNQGADNPKAKL